MACTNPQNPSCPNCNKSGLAILPVRYCVVPKEVDAFVPAPLGNKVLTVPLRNHNYALRTLRQGFLYLFHEKHPSGSHIKWEVYAVSEAGTLWKMPSASAIRLVSEDPQCARNGHNLPASVITIEEPQHCKRVWLAFSEHIWSAETLAEFERDVKLRDRRMQCLEPATWIAAGGYRHGLAASKRNIEQILEYRPRYDAGTLNRRGMRNISKPAKDGSYFKEVLARESTVHISYARPDQSETVASLMQQIGKQTKGKDHPPMIMGLWDAVGIVHELNGYRNDVVGWSEKYMDELEQQVSAMMTIDGLREVLGERAAQFQEEVQQAQPIRQPDTEPIRARAATRPTQERQKLEEICDLIDDLRMKDISPRVIDPDHLLHRVNRLPEPQRSEELAKARLKADELVRARGRAGRKNVAYARAGAWKKYESRLDKPLLEKFKKNYQAFQDEVARIAEERTEDLVLWLESKSLLDAFSEFHGKNVHDGMVFDDQVGRALFGVNHSLVGQLKIAAWVDDMQATENNLIWRAMALNQVDAMRELDTYLKEASAHNDKRVLASSLGWDTVFQKSLKSVADVYKKANSLYVANDKAASAKGSMAFDVALKAYPTRGIDRQIMTTGDAIMRRFRINSVLDYGGEKMIQHLLSIRALVDPTDSLQLIRVQSKEEGIARQQTMERLRTARTFLLEDKPEMRTVQAEKLRAAWEGFKNSGTHSNAVKDIRLNLLVMFIEGGNFAKMMGEVLKKGDKKSWLALAASGMTITAGLCDITATLVKGIAQDAAGDFDKGASLWSYQRLKLAGGLLSAGGSAIGAYLDYEQYVSAKHREHTALTGLYGLRLAGGASSAIISVATALTYSTPYIRHLTTRSVLILTAKKVGQKEIPFLVARGLLMSMGAALSITLFTLQVLIWIFDEDELQIWCSLCSFGEKRDTRAGYASNREQMLALNKALVELALAPPAKEENSQRAWGALEEPTLEELRMYF
ncbi:T6SS effector BTH_I2691 family protein [Herbaspirillum rubrisubalbicans]|nr:T6SS effector BTH_I2691 family protein [Herbaspirillum rubrisubalbicans]